MMPGLLVRHYIPSSIPELGREIRKILLDRFRILEHQNYRS